MAESTKERGCFNFMGKKEDQSREDLVMTDLDAGKETTKKEKNELQRPHSHSRSSNEEEAEEGGERKKQKGLKETIMNEITGDKEGEERDKKETCVCMEKCNEEKAERVHTEEKNGFLEKIIEKLPGQHKGEEDTQTAPACEHPPGRNTEEKKGIIDKIKEKFPGHDKSD